MRTDLSIWAKQILYESLMGMHILYNSYIHSWILQTCLHPMFALRWTFWWENSVCHSRVNLIVPEEKFYLGHRCFTWKNKRVKRCLSHYLLMHYTEINLNNDYFIICLFVHLFVCEFAGSMFVIMLLLINPCLQQNEDISLVTKVNVNGTKLNLTISNINQSALA